MTDEDPTELMRALRGMTGTDHVGRTAHDAVTEIARLIQVHDALLSAAKMFVAAEEDWIATGRGEIDDPLTDAYQAARAAIAKATTP